MTKFDAPTQLLIGGSFISASHGGNTFDVLNPATDEVVSTLPDAGPEETLAAIDAADRSREAWSQTTGRERASVLEQAAQLMTEQRNNLATLITLEQGKPLAESQAEIDYASSFLSWFAGEAYRIRGDILMSPQRDKRILVSHRPVGIVAAITPWNFPAAAVTKKIGGALAAGCPVILKPSELTPLTALAIGSILQESGLPAGVMSTIVSSDPDRVARALLDDVRVRAISFTGSREVGERLMRDSAGTLKRLTLELGGHAPFIVFEDADMKAAIDGAIASKMRNMGQTCVCANRFYVHELAVDQFVDELSDRLRTLKVGNGLDTGVAIGPLISRSAVEKVNRHVSDAVTRGAKLVLDGRPDGNEAGTYCSPTVLREVTDEMIVCQEETFGPVSPVLTFQTEAEVIERANRNQSGLAGYCYTRDLGRAFRVIEKLQCGIIGINDVAISTAEAPFGGIKGSGYGREGGPTGIYEFLDPVYASIGQLHS